MAASKALEAKKQPVFTRSGLLCIENNHMVEQMTPKGNVILKEFCKHYPHEVILEGVDEKGAKIIYSKAISQFTGEELAKNFPQSITVGREATYFIPKGKFATAKGTAFALPRSIIATIRQELSSKDLHNRVYHNRTYPGCMIGAWKLAQDNEDVTAGYAAKKAQAKKAIEGK